MSDRLEAMALLVAVVDAGSFSGASRRLGVPLATVSRKVAELEAQLGARLLQRSTRRLALTEAGQSYVAACRRILDEVGEAERAVSGEYASPRGELAVTAPVVFGRKYVTPIIAEFLQAYPDIDVRLSLNDRVVHLLEEHVDVAVRIGELPDSGMVAARVGEIRRVVCASPDYLGRRGAPQVPADLEAHDCVTMEGLMAARAWTFLAQGREVSVPVRSRLLVNAAEAAIEAAAAGLGPTCVLSYQVAEAVRDGRLRIVLDPYERAPWPVHIVHAGQRILPLKVRAFLDFARPRLRARLAESEGLLAGGK